MRAIFCGDEEYGSRRAASLSSFPSWFRRNPRFFGQFSPSQPPWWSSSGEPRVRLAAADTLGINWTPEVSAVRCTFPHAHAIPPRGRTIPARADLHIRPSICAPLPLHPEVAVPVRQLTAHAYQRPLQMSQRAKRRRSDKPGSTECCAAPSCSAGVASSAKSYDAGSPEAL